ncbi:MAG: ABC transporter substrate-binding protein, partial [Rhodospirillales bacterium]|nr:ABC transporter substrate-binding protein [Rhodospirillales bacterium]
RMVAEFESEYARPPSSYAAVAYDAGLWLDAALKATQGKIGSRDEFRVALRKADWTSVRGPVRFDANQFILQPIWLRQVAKTPKGRFGNEWRGVLAKDYHDPAATECPMR